ncbi:MAG: hypothetical protein AAGM84_08975 [Pseudomonadota bacterium]
MSRFLAFAGPAVALLLGACTPQYVERVATSEQDLPERVAIFPGAPTVLRDSFRAACTDPGDQFVRVNRQIRQCRSLPTPDLAAFLLVQYDGALEVPKLIIQTEERGTGSSVEVGFSYFAEVTQKSGGVRRIYFRDRQLDAFIDRLLVAAGGTLPG